MIGWQKVYLFLAGFVLSVALNHAVKGNAWMALFGGLLSAWCVYDGTRCGVRK